MYTIIKKNEYPKYTAKMKTDLEINSNVIQS